MLRGSIFATLFATLLLAAPVAHAQLQIGGRQANFGRHRLRGGFPNDPYTVSVVSGGGIDAQQVSAGCRGNVSRAPDVILNFRNPHAFLRFFAESDGDTTLVINDPNGRWICNDDGAGTGLNPMIDIQNPAAGQYDIWIGSYDRSANHRATLSITELTSVRPAGAQPQPQPQPIQPVQPIQPIQPVQPVQPVQPIQPFIPNNATSYVFQGQFEQVPATFHGRSLDEVYNNCMQFMGSANLSHVDDIVVNGRHIRNGPSYWNASAMCSIAVLNSRAQGPVGARVTGTVETGFFFDVAGPDAATVSRIIQTHLPAALAHESHIDDIVINGNPFRNGPSFWNGQQVAGMVAAQIQVVRGAPVYR